MHSCIFQVSKKPIKKNDWADEERYYDESSGSSFVGHIADYVDSLSSPDRTEAIKYLGEELGESARIDSGRIIIVDKMSFFKPLFEQFKDNLKKAEQLGENAFAAGGYSEASRVMWCLNQAYNDKDSYYVDDNDESFGIVTLTDFMRNVKDGESYYLGTVMDYHC